MLSIMSQNPRRIDHPERPRQGTSRLLSFRSNHSWNLSLSLSKIANFKSSSNSTSPLPCKYSRSFSDSWDFAASNFGTSSFQAFDINQISSLSGTSRLTFKTVNSRSLWTLSRNPMSLFLSFSSETAAVWHHHMDVLENYSRNFLYNL